MTRFGRIDESLLLILISHGDWFVDRRSGAVEWFRIYPMPLDKVRGTAESPVCCFR